MLLVTHDGTKVLSVKEIGKSACRCGSPHFFVLNEGALPQTLKQRNLAPLFDQNEEDKTKAGLLKTIGENAGVASLERIAFVTTLPQEAQDALAAQVDAIKAAT